MRAAKGAKKTARARAILPDFFLAIVIVPMRDGRGGRKDERESNVEGKGIFVTDSGSLSGERPTARACNARSGVHCTREKRI